MSEDLETRWERAMRPRKYRPTMAQLEVLSILASCPDGFSEPGEIWLNHSSYDNVPSPLGMYNFGRSMDALKLHVLITQNDHGWTITDAGRAALEASK